MPVLDRLSALRYETMSRHFADLIEKSLAEGRLSENERDYLEYAEDFFDELFLALGETAAVRRGAFGVSGNQREQIDASLLMTLRAWQDPDAYLDIESFKGRLGSYRDTIRSLRTDREFDRDTLFALKEFFATYNNRLSSSFSV